ncbi:small GTPase [Naegleria gruberi]|uniref:Small GTPase n=1 Tax=Naegleria gruberi TaxID=5762 RepID=D2VT30_NAEGR|nr:small GTPase [Naegleria gruberi]EFC40075.1 small GTPase [Naegleria gruberi]|eukprot:XP_002672819.1 small GTPase [Naegleria gruberi]
MGQQTSTETPSSSSLNHQARDENKIPSREQSENLLYSTGKSLHFPVLELPRGFKRKSILSTIVSDVELLPIGIFNGIRRGYGGNDEYFNQGEEKDGWLTNFPHEIILHILQFLDMESIGRMQRVSKRFLMYWTRFEVLWKDLRRKSPMLYMFSDMESYENVKNVLLKRFVIDEDVELPQCAQYIFVGSSGCGKSTLIDRAFNQLPFSENYTPSITFPVIDKHYLYGSGTEFAFKIWDTCGNQTYLSLFKSVYSRANVFVYCFDLNSHKSFEEMIEIYHEMTVKDISDYNINDRCFLLLGLKSDLDHQVTRLEIYNFLKMVEPEPQQKTIHTTKVQYFELSSKEECSDDDLLFPFLYAVATLKTML